MGVRLIDQTFGMRSFLLLVDMHREAFRGRLRKGLLPIQELSGKPYSRRRYGFDDVFDVVLTLRIEHELGLTQGAASVMVTETRDQLVHDRAVPDSTGRIYLAPTRQYIRWHPTSGGFVHVRTLPIYMAVYERIQHLGSLMVHPMPLSLTFDSLPAKAYNYGH